MTKIAWTNPAVRDLAAIKDYIAKDSPAFARVFVAQVIRVVESIETFPERGRNVPETNDPNLRELIYQNYRIIYRLRLDRATILAIIHCARGPRIIKDLEPK